MELVVLAVGMAVTLFAFVLMTIVFLNLQKQISDLQVSQNQTFNAVAGRVQVCFYTEDTDDSSHRIYKFLSLTDHFTCAELATKYDLMNRLYTVLSNYEVAHETLDHFYTTDQYRRLMIGELSVASFKLPKVHFDEFATRRQLKDHVYTSHRRPC